MCPIIFSFLVWVDTELFSNVIDDSIGNCLIAKEAKKQTSAPQG